MEKRTQKTIEKTTKIEGIGLHTGEKSRLVFKPAPANSGVIFIRTDVPGAKALKPEIDNLLDTSRFPRRTSIGNEHFQIHTVEHLLSALYSMGIDNIFIEMEDSECPGLDGSTKPFVELFRKAGIKTLNEEREIFVVKEPVYVSDNGTHIIALPNDELKISYMLDYPNTALSSQYNSYLISPEVYEKEISPARTFCLREEVEPLRKIGLGKGSNYKNTLVIDSRNGDVVDNEFRFKDEPVRHKISDLIGDLAFFGDYVAAHIIGIKSGHSMNTKLVRKLKELYNKERMSGIGAPSLSFDSYGTLYTEEISKIIPHRYDY